jgi:glycosyltransferase involved in cell wall biosynthesis
VPEFRRHCMLVHSYYPLLETRVQREAEALVRAGFVVDVLCPRDRGESRREVHRGVNVVRLPVRIHKRTLVAQLANYLVFFVMAALAVTARHLRRRYAVVQVHNLPDFLVFAATVPRLLGARVVLDLHDLMPEFFEAKVGERRLLGSVVRIQERASTWFADHVITVSEHWKAALVARGLSESKCSVVMNLADEELFPPLEDPVHARPGLRLIYHGNVTYRYGLDLVIDALASTSEEMPDIEFHVIGRGDHRDELADRVRRLGLSDRVELREPLPAEELRGQIEWADVGVVPYRDDVFTDGLIPTKLLEYAAMGLPTVVARTSGIASVFDDTMVRFFTPGSLDSLVAALDDVYRDLDLRRRLAAGMSTFATSWSWSAHALDYVQTIERLIEGQVDVEPS